MKAKANLQIFISLIRLKFKIINSKTLIWTLWKIQRILSKNIEKTPYASNRQNKNNLNKNTNNKLDFLGIKKNKNILTISNNLIENSNFNAAYENLQNNDLNKITGKSIENLVTDYNCSIDANLYPFNLISKNFGRSNLNYLNVDDKLVFQNNFISKNELNSNKNKISNPEFSLK